MKDSGDKLPHEFNNSELLNFLKRFLDVYEKNSEETQKSAQQFARLNNQKLKQAFAGLAVSILIAAGGFLLSKYLEESRHERENAQAQIERKLKKLEEISVALTEVRRVKDDTLIDCGTNSYNKRDVEHRRLTARINLIKAARNVDFYFGTDAFSEILLFIDWESSFNDYCAKDLPNDLEWRERHRKTEALMRTYFPRETFIHKSAQ